MTDIKFDTYIEKILRQVHPDTGMSGETKVQMNLIVNYVLEQLMETTNALVRQTSLSTISSRDVQNAVRLYLPGELSKHAISEGTKAVTRFNSSSSDSGAGKKASKKPATSRSFASGLQMSVARVERVMRSMMYVDRLGQGAPIYLAAVVEYIAAEILELAGNAARDNKKQRIKPRHVLLAVRNDEELNKMFLHAILGGGVVPNIHSRLLKVSKKSQHQED